MKYCWSWSFPLCFSKLNSPLCSRLSLPLNYVEEDDVNEILECECMDKIVEFEVACALTKQEGVNSFARLELFLCSCNLKLLLCFC